MQKLRPGEQEFHPCSLGSYMAGLGFVSNQGLLALVKGRKPEGPGAPWAPGLGHRWLPSVPGTVFPLEGTRRSPEGKGIRAPGRRTGERRG